MFERASDRVTINQSEFEAFIAENQQLVERCEKLLKKVDEVSKLNKDLEGQLRDAQQKLGGFENRLSMDVRQGDEILRKARATMTRLIEDVDRRISE